MEKSRAEGEKTLLDSYWRVLPGVLVAVVIGIISRLIENYIPILNDVMLAIILGMIIRNTLGLAPNLKTGVDFCLKKILKLAIILLGTSLSLKAIVQIGGQALIVILIMVIVAINLTYFVGKKFGLGDKLAMLIGVGTAICGATAIVASGPVIDAEEQDISLAIAVIFIFNTIALVAYPVIGRLLGMTDVSFGTWVGTAVHDTSSVVATGFAFSDHAGAVATVVKLTRTVLLVPLMVFLGISFSKNRNEKDGKGAGISSLAKAFPWFILGFVLMAVFNSFGVFSAALLAEIQMITKFLILMVMAAIGLGVDLKKLRGVGPNFLYTGMVASIIMAILSLTLINLLGI